MSFPSLHSLVYSSFAQMLPVRNQRGCGTGEAVFGAAVSQGVSARTERLGKGADLSGEPRKARFSLGLPLGVRTVGLGVGVWLGPFASVGLRQISPRLSGTPIFGSSTSGVLDLFPGKSSAHSLPRPSRSRGAVFRCGCPAPPAQLQRCPRPGPRAPTTQTIPAVSTRLLCPPPQLAASPCPLHP